MVRVLVCEVLFIGMQKYHTEMWNEILKKNQRLKSKNSLIPPPALLFLDSWLDLTVQGHRGFYALLLLIWQCFFSFNGILFRSFR